MRHACLSVVLALIACLGARQAHSQSDHVLTNLSSPGAMQTAWLLPSYPDKKFPAGKLVEAVVGLHNEGSDTYNVSLIAGSLNSPADFSLHVQNFTLMPYSEQLAPGDEVSLTYRFVPDSRAPPRDFVVALTAFYSDSRGQWYSSTFFNETVDIVEVKKVFDWELISLASMFGGAVLACVYLLYCWVVSKGWLKPQKKKAKKTVVAKEVDPEEWVKGTPYDSFRKRNVSSGKKG